MVVPFKSKVQHCCFTMQIKVCKKHCVSQQKLLKHLRIQASSIAPVFFTARGAPVFQPRPLADREGWSAARRHIVCTFRCASFGEGRCALRRSMRCLPADGPRFQPGTRRSHAVSQLLAGDPSIPGRSPITARGFKGCVHPLPASTASADVGFTRYRPG